MKKVDREAVGRKTSLLGIFINLILFAAKFLAGSISSSIAIVADGFNNLSDSLSSVVSLIGFKVASKKPDREHPYGHGRIEYICALIVAFFIFLTAFTFLKDSIVKIINPQELKDSLILYITIFISILLKIFLGIINRVMGKKINSVSLMATSSDAFNDVLVTFSTAVSIAVYSIWKVNIDAFIGIIVSLLIFKSGLDVLKSSVSPLLGMKADKSLVEEIENTVLKGKYVLGIHDLIVHTYGPSKIFASVHVEVPSDCTLIEVHEIMDEIENDVRKRLGVELTIHFDPVETESKEVNLMKRKVSEVLNKICPSLKFHELKLVPGKKKKTLIFDLLYSFDCKIKEDELLKKIKDELKKSTSCNVLINLDYPLT